MRKNSDNQMRQFEKFSNTATLLPTSPNFNTFRVGLQKRCLLSHAAAKAFRVTPQPWTPLQSLQELIDDWAASLISR